MMKNSLNFIRKIKFYLDLNFPPFFFIQSKMSGSIRTFVSLASLSLAGYYYHKYHDISIRYEKLQQKHKEEFEKSKNYFYQKKEESFPTIITEKVTNDTKKPNIIDLKKENKIIDKIENKEKIEISSAEKAKNLLFDENFRIKRRFI